MRTALYKAYVDNELVYVGVSKSVLRRVSEHPWADSTSIEIEHFATREEAEAEERRVIEQRTPAYNIMHNHVLREKRQQRLGRKVHRGDAAEILKRARRLAGLTQQEMAGKLGISQQSISKYETARTQPTLPTLKILLTACDLEMRIHLVPIGEDN